MPRLQSLVLSVVPWVVVLSTVVQPSNAETCRFTYQPSRVGDEALQTIHTRLKLTVTMHQAGQTIDSLKQDIDRKQKRRMTVLSRNQHRVLSAKVVFLTCEQKTNTNGQADPSVEDPVVGKTYVVARPEQQLIVTYEDGSLPPEEERRIVRTNVDGIGRPNSLARFFDGRTMVVGESIKLPSELASELIGFAESIGKVTQFEMKLVSIGQIEPAQSDADQKRNPRGAVLDVSIDAGQPEDDGMKMRIRGQVLMEIDTCRTHTAEFSGPVAVIEHRGPPGFQFTVSGHGKLHVAIRSENTRLAEPPPARVSNATATVSETSNTLSRRPR
jgi:hypothetical protein